MPRYEQAVESDPLRIDERRRAEPFEQPVVFTRKREERQLKEWV